MADSDEEEEERAKDEPIAKFPSKWELKDSFLSQFHNQSSNLRSMVSIKDTPDSSIIFPPIHHENIYTAIQHHKSDAVSFTPSSFSSFSVESDVDSDEATSALYSSSSGEFVGEVGIESPVLRLSRFSWWVNLGLGVLYSKVRGGFRSFRSRGSFAAFAALVMGFLYVRFRRRLRTRDQGTEQLRGLVREKDERINQLLHQIAQMNQLLLARK